MGRDFCRWHTKCTLCTMSMHASAHAREYGDRRPTTWHGQLDTRREWGCRMLKLCASKEIEERWGSNGQGMGVSVIAFPYFRTHETLIYCENSKFAMEPILSPSFWNGVTWCHTWHKSKNTKSAFWRWDALWQQRWHLLWSNIGLSDYQSDKNIKLGLVPLLHFYQAMSGPALSYTSQWLIPIPGIPFGIKARATGEGQGRNR